MGVHTSAVPTEARRECWILTGARANRQLWAEWHGCWELNSGPLQKQLVLLTTDPSLQPLLLSYISLIYLAMSEIEPSALFISNKCSTAEFCPLPGWFSSVRGMTPFQTYLFIFLAMNRLIKSFIWRHLRGLSLTMHASIQFEDRRCLYTTLCYCKHSFEYEQSHPD